LFRLDISLNAIFHIGLNLCPSRHYARLGAFQRLGAGSGPPSKSRGWPPALSLIGKFILQTPSLRARESVRKIAARLGVSTNTVLKVSRVPFEAASVAAP
jgi:hypothetical protein